MDKLLEIEERYITNNKWAWSSYINLVDKDQLKWLIKTIKELRDENRKLRTKSWYPVHEDNLRLAQELEEVRRELDQYKGAVSI